MMLEAGLTIGVLAIAAALLIVGIWLAMSQIGPWLARKMARFRAILVRQTKIIFVNLLAAVFHPVVLIHASILIAVLKMVNLNFTIEGLLLVVFLFVVATYRFGESVYIKYLRTWIYTEIQEFSQSISKAIWNSLASSEGPSLQEVMRGLLGEINHHKLLEEILYEALIFVSDKYSAEYFNDEIISLLRSLAGSLSRTDRLRGVIENVLLTFSPLKTLRKSILGLFSREKRSLYWTSATSLIWKRPIKKIKLKESPPLEEGDQGILGMTVMPAASMASLVESLALMLAVSFVLGIMSSGDANVYEVLMDRNALEVKRNQSSENLERFLVMIEKALLPAHNLMKEDYGVQNASMHAYTKDRCWWISYNMAEVIRAPTLFEPRIDSLWTFSLEEEQDGRRVKEYVEHYILKFMEIGRAHV